MKSKKDPENRSQKIDFDKYLSAVYWDMLKYENKCLLREKILRDL